MLKVIREMKTDQVWNGDFQTVLYAKLKYSKVARRKMYGSTIWR